jgi:putative Mg2+ transporter-C (MgtC) family protein
MEDSIFQIFGNPILIPAYAKQLFLATFIGLLIGLERELKNKSATLRTFAFICCGSCLFSILSIEAAGGTDNPEFDITRIAAQIVTGIGFVGGGVIFKTQDRVDGITSAAMIWLTAAIGMACGFNQISTALWSFSCLVFIYVVSVMLYNFVDYLRIQEKTKVVITHEDD